MLVGTQSTLAEGPPSSKSSGLGNELVHSKIRIDFEKSYQDFPRPRHYWDPTSIFLVDILQLLESSLLFVVCRISHSLLVWSIGCGAKPVRTHIQRHPSRPSIP